MAHQYTIHLHHLIFHAYHGVHEEERILGNSFEVNVSFDLETSIPITSLEQTVNYAAVYELIKQRMLVATPLLETLAQDLTDKIHDYDSRVKSVSVWVEKKNPPIPNFGGSVSVQFKKDF